MLSRARLISRTSALLPFALFPFTPQSVFGILLLIAELRHNPVNRYPSYDADNIVFLLVAVHVEQHFECTSCHTHFLSLKLSINELYLVNQPKPYGEKFSTEYQNHLSRGNDLATFLLHKFTFFALPRFMPLSSFVLTNALFIAVLKTFPPFYSSFLQIFSKFISI